MSGSATPDASGVGTAFKGVMNDGNCATSLCCTGCIDGELSTMNTTSSLLTNDAVKTFCVTRVGSGVGATSGWEPHAHSNGNPDPSTDQRIHDHTRLEAIMRPSWRDASASARPAPARRQKPAVKRRPLQSTA